MCWSLIARGARVHEWHSTHARESACHAIAREGHPAGSRPARVGAERVNRAPSAAHAAETVKPSARVDQGAVGLPEEPSARTEPGGPAGARRSTALPTTSLAARQLDCDLKDCGGVPRPDGLGIP